MENEFIQISVENYLKLKNIYKKKEVIKIFNMFTSIIKKINCSYHIVSKIVYNHFKNKIIDFKIIVYLFCYNLELKENKYDKVLKKIELNILQILKLSDIKILDKQILLCIKEFLLDDWNPKLQYFIDKIYNSFDLKETENFILQNLKPINNNTFNLKLKNKDIEIIKNKKIKKVSRTNLKSELNKYLIKKKNYSNLININTNISVLDPLINSNNENSISDNILNKNEIEYIPKVEEDESVEFNVNNIFKINIK